MSITIIKSPQTWGLRINKEESRLCHAMVAARSNGRSHSANLSNTGIVLDNCICRDIGIPVVASVVYDGVVLQCIDLRVSLNQLQGETLISVPSNMAWIRSNR